MKLTVCQIVFFACSCFNYCIAQLRNSPSEQAADSLLLQINSASDSASAAALKQFNDSISLSSMDKRSSVGLIDRKILKGLKVNRFTGFLISSEANRWDIQDNSNIYFQNSFQSCGAILGIPLNGGAVFINNYFVNGRNDQKITYKIGYSQRDFLEKLQAYKNDPRKKLMNGNKQVDKEQLIMTNFSKDSSLNKMLSSAGCNWSDLINMQKEEFESKYSSDAIKEKVADAEKLKNYYASYPAKTKKDSLILQDKIKSNDQEIEILKEGDKKIKRLIHIKQKVDQLSKQITVLQNGNNEIGSNNRSLSEIVREDEGLSKLQKFMLRVKGLSIGQHAVSTNNLALRNYLQNGVTFEYESDKYYFMLTKGSQRKLEYSQAFFPSQNSTGSAIKEYYQYNSRYKLTGASIKKISKNKNYVQLSLMNFNKVNDSLYPTFFAKQVNVLTLSNHVNLGSFKFSIDLSKSMFRNGDDSIAGDKAYKSGFFESTAFGLKLEHNNSAKQEKQKLSFVYNSREYNNPGLYGGNIIPGIEISHSIDKRFSKKVKASNEGSYYSFEYAGNISLQSIRDRINVNYKIKKVWAGVMIAGDYGKQIQYNHKKYQNSGIDVLATGQLSIAAGEYYINTNNGVGYGYNKQELFGEGNSISFFTNNSITHNSFSLGLDMDKFNSRNSEVFLTDSSALIIESTFNLEGYLSYGTKKGLFAQAGIEYRKLNTDVKQFYITANYKVALWKRLVAEGKVSFPISTLRTADYINNTFNSKLTYNIGSYGK